jgi:Signal transduction histidine kinase regulating citrate/malate metabolism
MLYDLMKSIFIVIYEAVCCRIFMKVFLRERILFRGSGMLYVVLLSGVFLGWALGTYEQSGYIYRCFGIVFSIFIFSLLFFEGKWTKKLFICSVFYGIMCGIDYLFAFLADIILNVETISAVTWVMIALLSKTVLFIIVQLMVCKREQIREMQMKSAEWIIMLCFPLLSIMIQVLMVFSYEGRGNSVGYLAVSFGIVLVNVVMFEWLGHISEQEKKWNQIQLLQENNRVRMQAYYEIDIDYQESKRILHDYNNQLCCIQGLLKQGEIKKVEEYADKLIGTLPDWWEEIDVHNPVINVLLNQKYRLAKSKGIAILFYVNDLSDLWLEEQDIVVLLSNLMDNAIEACDKLEEGHKVIKLKMICEERQMVLSIQNPVSGKVLICDNEICTNKNDKKKHGIGLKNIQMVLDKYQGIGMMRYDDGQFHYTVAIPML